MEMLPVFSAIFSIGYGKEKSNRKGNKKAPRVKTKGLGMFKLPLMFSSWNQIIQDMLNIYKLKELITPLARDINPI
jgi:hypothetical protein